MKKIITLIKTSKTLFKFLVYLYYFYRRIYKFFTETNERKEYYTQIEEIKRNKKIIVDISFCGIGDLLVWSLIPELLKKQYNVNFYISKKTFDLIKNKDVFDLIFGLNPYFKGVCDDGVFLG